MRAGKPVAVLVCLAGAGLALFAATRVWAVRVEARPGLSDLRTEQTGSDVLPWLVGLAIVAVAGAGALLAAGGLVRRILGGLLVAAGAGIVAGAVLARVSAGPGASGLAGTAWPAACVLGGAAVAVGGVLAARHGHLWPAMSSRYERSTAVAAVTADQSSVAPADSRAFWEALDRGEDPTRI